MRISDWSSDVCSSDLLITITTDLVEAQIDTAGGEIRHLALLKHEADGENASGPVVLFNTNTPHTYLGQTGLTGGVYPNHKSMRSEEHTSELQSLMRITYAVF